MPGPCPAEVPPSVVAVDRAPEWAHPQTSVTSVASVAGPGREWLGGLDGLRGLAAVFVVVDHVFVRAFPGYPVDHAPLWAAWFVYGRFAVVVFIVLSGLSLALSPARHGWRLDGISRFAHRRARRIPPPYWAALVFSLAVAWLLVARPGRRFRTRISPPSTACWYRASSLRRVPTDRSGRWRLRPSSASCSPCCC